MLHHLFNPYCLIVVFCFWDYFCIAQNFLSIPIEQYHFKKTLQGEKNNLYFEDLNNNSSFYTGSWKWTEGNSELIIHLYKASRVFIDYNNNFPHEVDLIYGYYVYRENGEVLIDTKPHLLQKLNNNQLQSAYYGGIGLKPTRVNYSDVVDDVNLAFVDYNLLKCLGSNLGGGQVPTVDFNGIWTFTSSTTALIGLSHPDLNLSIGCQHQTLHSGFPGGQGISITKIANVAPPL